MRLPHIKYSDNARKYEQYSFGGINRRKVSGDGTIFDMIDISADDYPILSTAENRYKDESVYDNPWYYGMADKPFVIAGKRTGTKYKTWSESITSVKAGDIYTANNKLYKAKSSFSSPSVLLRTNPACAVSYWQEYDGILRNGDFYASLYYDGIEIEGMELIPGKKVCTYINDHILIYPDKVYYNTRTKKMGYLQGTTSGSFTSPYSTQIYHTAFSNSNGYCCGFLGDSKGVTGNGSGSMDTLFIGATSNGVYGNAKAALGGTYDLYDLRKMYHAGDSVYVSTSGSGAQLVAGYYVIQEVGKSYLRFNSRVFAAATRLDDTNPENLYYIGSTKCYSTRFIIKKTVPELDYACVANNRVWGCKGYTVYASSLGNPYTWQNYTGIETDAAYLEAGSDEEFTGCCEYGGYPMFFGENKIYRVYGTLPSNFALQAVGDIGIKKGASRSVCTVNSVLMYLAPSGVFAYNGGIPALVSGELNDIIYDCMASTDGFKYYGVMTVGDEKRLYVYDIRTGIWSSEHFEGDVIGFAWYENDLTCMNDKGEIFTVSKPTGKYGTEISKVDNNAVIEFNDFYGGSMGTKDVGKIIIRASVDPKYNALYIYVQYDSDGRWHRVGRIYNQNTRKKVCEFGFFPRKCDHFRLKLECQGKFTLYGIGREITNN